MSAVRLARAATGRARDRQVRRLLSRPRRPLLAAAGSGVATLGLPDSPGVTAATVARHAGRAVQRSRRGGGAVRSAAASEIAAVLVEPVPGNMGVVPPVPGFLQGLRAVTRALRRAARLRRGDDRLAGASARARRCSTGSSPTSPASARSSAAGFRPRPTAAGATSWSRSRRPGPVYQAGTLSGNPLAMAAGLATLDVLARAGHLGARRASWRGSVAEAIERPRPARRACR